MLNIRWLQDCLIFNMEIPILVRQHLYIDTPPGDLMEPMLSSHLKMKQFKDSGIPKPQNIMKQPLPGSYAQRTLDNLMKCRVCSTFLGDYV